MAVENKTPPPGPRGAASEEVLAPRTITRITETTWHAYTREVKDARRLTIKAIKLGDVFVVPYRDDDGGTYYAVVSDKVVYDPKDDVWEAYDSLVWALKKARNRQVEVVEWPATQFIIEERKINKHTLKEIDRRVYYLVEWEYNGQIYSLKLSEGEEVAPHV